MSSIPMVAGPATDGEWELKYRSNGHIPSVRMRIHSPAYGIAHEFALAFERILQDMDPQIYLEDVHEI